MINSKEIKRRLRLSPLANYSFYHLLRFYLKRNKMEGVLKRCQLEPQEENQMRSMMKEAMLKYRWDFDECIFYHYATISENERAAFVPEYEKNIFCDEVNNPRSAKKFDSKWTSYCCFKEFYKRDCVRIDDELSLNNFLEKHRDFIIKPDSSACGRGIKVLRTKDMSDALRQINHYANTLYRGGIVEELIEQDEELRAIHPQSVNTVRIPTVRTNNRVLILHPFFRCGRCGTVVDNAGAGGILSNVDVETGTVYAASDEQGHSYTTHPDSKLPLVGFTIPRWNEAIDLVSKLALVIPDVRYVGWDLALTKNGWVMVEGNDRGQFVFQIADRKGFREEYTMIRQTLLNEI